MLLQLLLLIGQMLLLLLSCSPVGLLLLLLQLWVSLVDTWLGRHWCPNGHCGLTGLFKGEKLLILMSSG